MDRVEKYRQIIHKILQEYARYKPANGDIETEVIIDPKIDHYEVLHVGWDDQRRIHGSVIHLDIIQEKIWIQHDGTNRPVADELCAAGVPKEDIVLGFHPPQVRHYTDYGVG